MDEKIIQKTLNNLIDENNLVDFFQEINILKDRQDISIQNLHLLNNLKLDYIHGNVSANFYDRLRTWVDDSIISNSYKKNNPRSSITDDIRKLIIEGDVGVAIEEMLKLTHNSNMINNVSVLSFRYNNLQEDIDLGLINESEKRMQLAIITNSLLNTLTKLEKTSNR